MVHVLRLYDQAINYLKENNVDQWQNGYPNRQSLLDDILHEHSYVFLVDNCIVATVAVIFGDEPDYAIIHEGSWLNERPYVTIHRLVVDQNHKGSALAQKMLLMIQDACLKHGIFDIRIDTHQDNHSMRRFLTKNGFEKCGVIYLKNGDPRIAYHKSLNGINSE